MPTSTSSEMRNSQITFVRNFLFHSSCGTIKLQKINVQYRGAYGPVMRFQMANFSNGFALYHEMNASKIYEYATICAVASMTLAQLSRCRMVIRSPNPYIARRGIASTRTIAKPE